MANKRQDKGSWGPERSTAQEGAQVRTVSWAARGRKEGEYNKLGARRKAGEKTWGVSHLKPDALQSSSSWRVSCRVHGWL